MFKHWGSLVVIGLSGMLSSYANANDTYNTYLALNAVSKQSSELNQALMVYPQFANSIQQDQADGITVSLQNVMNVENNNIEMIVHRTDEHSAQYQRVNGKALPFFIMLRNQSTDTFSFKPQDLRLVVNGKVLKPINNRRLETLLKTSHIKNADVSQLIEGAEAVGDLVNLFSVNTALNLAQTAVTGLASGQSLDEVMQQTLMSNKALKGLYTVIKNDAAQKFQEGDRFLLHFDEMSVKPKQITSLTMFFEGVSVADKNIQLETPIKHGMNQYQFKFKFMDPVLNLNELSQNTTLKE